MTGGRVAQPVAEFRHTARTPNLRRAQLSFGAEFTTYWIVTIALGVLAYEHGGAAAVGIVGLVRLLPSAFLAPPASVVADRYKRNLVLVWVGLVRVATLGGAALAVNVSSPVPAYALATVAMVAHTLYRPTHSALLPTLCKTAEDLTSANVVRGMLDSVSALLGPLLAGILIGPLGIQGLFAVCAASLRSVWLIWRVDYEAPPRVAEQAAVRPAREVVVGLSMIRRDADIRLITVLGLLQAFIRGCFTGFSLVVALQLLGLPLSGVGVVTAGFGIGAVVGSFAASLLVGSRRLGQWYGVGITGWGVAFIALAAVSNEVLALVLFAVVGVANAIVDVTAFTLFQWLIPDEAMGRVFTAFESILALSAAVGSIAASGLIALLGVRGALVAAGLVTPVGVALALPGLRRIDAHVREEGDEVGLLQRVAMLAALPFATVCRLAAAAAKEVVSAGATVVEEGTNGDDVYVIVDGRAEVSADGHHVADLGSADCFGEIACLTGSRRTSTVRAATRLELLRFKGPLFVCAVAGYSASYKTASALVEERLDRALSRSAASSVREWHESPTTTSHGTIAHHHTTWRRRGA